MMNTVLISKLKNLKLSLDKDTLNLRSIQTQINELQNLKDRKNYGYLENLLYPKRNRGSKIPSQIPIPSCSFQLRSTATLSTNDSGNLVFLFNPYFLYNETAIGKTFLYRYYNKSDGKYYTRTFMFSQYLSSFFIYNGNDLDGLTITDTDFFEGVNMNQKIPNVYNKYRLVSAEMSIKYIGQLEKAMGVIGGGIVYDKNQSIGGRYYRVEVSPTPPYDPTYPTFPLAMFNTKYMDFNNIRQAEYYTENNILEGLRMLYFPIDNKYEEYIKLYNGETQESKEENLDVPNPSILVYPETYKTGFNWVGYIQNGVAEANSYQLDLCCNFEALPTATALDYFPVSICDYSMTKQDRISIIEDIRNNSIQKLIN